MQAIASRAVERVIASQPASAGTFAGAPRAAAIARATPWARGSSSTTSARSASPRATRAWGRIRTPASRRSPTCSAAATSTAIRPGTTGIVTAGGAQWMTAGRGIVHSERPLADGDGRDDPARHPALDLAAARAEDDAAALPAHRRRADRRDAPARAPRFAWWRARSPARRARAETLMPAFLAHAAVEPGATRRARRRRVPRGGGLRDRGRGPLRRRRASPAAQPASSSCSPTAAARSPSRTRAACRSA